MLVTSKRNLYCSVRGYRPKAASCNIHQRMTRQTSFSVLKLSVTTPHIFFYLANFGGSRKHEIQRKLFVTRSDRKSAHNAHNGERTIIITLIIGITFDNIFAHLHNLFEPPINIAKKSRKKWRRKSRKKSLKKSRN